MVNSELKYYVIAVRRNKKKDVTLFLVEAAYREMVERGYQPPGQPVRGPSGH